MKMIAGTGTISNYGSYVNNCQRNQMPYKIPVTSLSDVQLYISMTARPDAVQYQLIHTCGALGGTIDNITTSAYVVGQDSNDNWYGVFRNFTGATPVCFVIAITLTFGITDTIYFSDEYCIENNCESLTLLKGCYGNLDNKISYNRQGIYFGTTDAPDAMGDLTVVYKHEIYLRNVEVFLSAIKTTFKQGRTRNFRTEEQDIYQFLAAPVPEWYLREVKAVFVRGEVYIGEEKYLLNETGYELIDACMKMWKPSVTLHESYYQSFSCEADPCSPPVEECCDPSSVAATVVFDDNVLTCCDPEIIDAYVETESGSETEYSEISFPSGIDAENNDSDAIAFTYENKTLEEGRIYLLLAGQQGSPDYGSVSATTTTWDLVAQLGDSTRRLSVFVCVPGATVMGEDIAFIGFTSTGYFASLLEINGVDTADPIVQAVTDSDTSANPSITMAALESHGKNGVLAIFYNSVNPFDGTPEAGWSELYDNGSGDPVQGSYVMSRLETTDNTPTVTASSSDWIGIAIELNAAEVLP